MKFMAVLVLGFLGIFTATAFAANAVAPSPDDTYALLKAVVDAFTHGQKLYAGMLGLVAVVALVKKVAPKWKKLDDLVHTDIGGSALTLVGSFALAMATTLATGGSPRWQMAKAALYIAIGAAGGYALVKRLLIDPVLRPFAAKCPAWTQPLFAVVFYIFDRKTPVQESEDAGQAAVEAKPSQGLAGNTHIKEVE